MSVITDTIRLWNLTKNEFTRYFRGHRGKVTGLAVNPADDTFLSAGMDHMIRLWDTRTAGCQGILRFPAQFYGAPCVAFSPDGLAFAAGVPPSLVKLYDFKMCERGPFAEASASGKPLDFNYMQFDQTGMYLLAATNEGCHVFDLTRTASIKSFCFAEADYKLEDVLQAGFSPDAKYIVCGDCTGSVHIWNRETKEDVLKLGNPVHSTNVKCALWNPKYISIATACSNLGLWIPRLDGESTRGAT